MVLLRLFVLSEIKKSFDKGFKRKRRSSKKKKRKKTVKFKY